jgi:UDP-glucose 4-epimerase
VPGTFNVAGEGTVRLHRLAQLLGRRRLPVPGPLLGLVAPLLGPGAAVPRALRRELRHGRGTDVRAAASTLGFRPRYSTEEALRAVLLRPSEGVPVTS